MKRPKIFGAMALFLSLSCSPGPGQDRPIPTVESVIFHPVTTNGETGEMMVLSLSDGAGQNHSSLCKGAVCSGVPKGSYEYTLKLAQNGRELHGRGDFYGTREWVTVFLGPTFGTAGEFDGLKVSGKVTGMPEGRGLAWIRLQPLFGPTSLEAPIDRNGDFEFDSVLQGKWLLLVLQGDRLLLNREYSPERDGATLRIDLKN